MGSMRVAAIDGFYAIKAFHRVHIAIHNRFSVEETFCSQPLAIFVGQAMSSRGHLKIESH